MYKRTKIYIPKPPTPERVVFKMNKEEAEKEYKECHEVEKRMKKKYEKLIRTRWKMHYTLSNCQWIADNLCDRLGSRKVKVAHLPPGHMETSHYDGKFVVIAHYVLHEWAVQTLLHELAHHIVCKEDMNAWSKEVNCHTGDYLWVLEMLYNMWYGKKK